MKILKYSLLALSPAAVFAMETPYHSFSAIVEGAEIKVGIVLAAELSPDLCHRYRVRHPIEPSGQVIEIRSNALKRIRDYVLVVESAAAEHWNLDPITSSECGSGDDFVYSGNMLTLRTADVGGKMTCLVEIPDLIMSAPDDLLVSRWRWHEDVERGVTVLHPAESGSLYDLHGLLKRSGREDAAQLAAACTGDERGTR